MELVFILVVVMTAGAILSGFRVVGREEKRRRELDRAATLRRLFDERPAA